MDDVLSAAEKISSKLNAPKGGEYARWLRETVGAIQAKETALLDALKALGCIVATTNYDSVLETAFGSDYTVWTNSKRVERILRGDDKSILHLHGHWRDPESVILGIRSYSRLLDNDCAQALTRGFSSTRSLLFVGCGAGLKDPNFSSLRAWLREVMGESEYRHFLLAREGEVDPGLTHDLQTERIYVLEYGKRYEDLPGFLLRLRSSDGGSVLLTPASPDSPPSERHERQSDAQIIPVQFRHRNISECDVPPHRSAWVGRDSELHWLGDAQFNVVAITGIGGQGKSVLAAEHLKRAMDLQCYETWDWRDCREEGDTLLTHFVRIVERFSPEVTPRDLVGASAVDLAPVVASIVCEHRSLFVFDNVDHYVDPEQHRAFGAFDILVRAIFRRHSAGRLIFTCRPKLQYDDPAFFHLPLSGFSEADTLRLFAARGTAPPDARLRQQIGRACLMTSGHPLWLNLIAVQWATHNSELENLLDRIDRGQTADLPAQTLGAIWDTLKEIDRTLLRLIAEVVRPENEDRIGELAEEEMNWNRYSKSLRRLRALDLVVVKSSPTAPDLLELHPMVRQYIRNRFPRKERSRFIHRIVKVVDGLINKLKPNLASEPTFSTLDVWTQRAELLLNAGRHAEALETLAEVESLLLGNGYVEEFVRVATRLYREIDWRDAIASEYKAFDELLTAFVSALSQLGRHSEADALLDTYEQTIPGKGARYISLCNSRCYALWYRGDFSAAKSWGRRGVESKAISSLDTIHDCTHNLALAERDSGNPEFALSAFLSGRTIEQLISKSPDPDDTPGTIYGNVGRCLWQMQRIREALICYQRSARKLQSTGTDSLLNHGYARFWIGEALEFLRAKESAYCFFRCAELQWLRVSPPLADKARGAAARVQNGAAGLRAVNFSNQEIESSCLRWISSEDSALDALREAGMEA